MEFDVATLEMLPGDEAEGLLPCTVTCQATCLFTCLFTSD